MDDKTYGLYLHHENYDHSSPLHHKDLSETLLERRLTSVQSMLEHYDPTKQPFRLTKWRWLALLIMNLLLLGYFAVFDSPSALQTAIQSALQIDDQQYGYLYSFLAIPNLILPLIAGYIVDVIGVRPSMLVFASFVLVGQAILTYGAQILSFDLMIIGRVIYSLGADPLNIAQVVMINRWFKGQEVGLALATGTLMAGAGKAVCSVAIPWIFDATGSLAAPFGFGTILCLFSLVCVIVMVIWDKANEKRELAIDPHYFRHTENAEKVNFKDIKKFKFIVWLLVLNFGLFDGIIFTIRSFLNDMYHNLYGFSNSTAGDYISIHYIVMAISSPLMGKFIDRFGLRSSIIFYNSFLGIIALLFYIIVPSCNQCATPVIPLILFGLYVGIDDAAVFACLPLVLDEKYLGTGYGLYYVVENLLLMILPQIGGFMKGAFASEAQGYFWVNIFLFGLSIVAMLESFALLIVDKKGGRILDKTVFSDENEDLKEIEEEQKKVKGSCSKISDSTSIVY